MLLFALASITSAGTFEILARMGDELPDGNGKYGFSLGVHDFNNAGQILVRADELVDTDDETALVLFTGSDASIIARENGDTGAGGKFGPFQGSSLNQNGEVAFVAVLLDTPDGFPSAIFRTSGNAMVKVAQTGDATPLGGTFASILTGFGGGFFNDEEKVVFRSNIDGGSSSAGIFSEGDSSNLQTVAHDGMSIGLYGTLSFVQSATFGDGSHVVFPASLQGTSATKGIFRGRGDDAVQIIPTPMAIADPASAEPNAIGDFFFFPSDLNVNGNGAVVFNATLINTVGGSDTNQGLFIAPPGSNNQPIRIAQKGDPVPGGDGKFDGSFLGMINDSQQVLFRSFLRETSAGTDWEGVFFRDSNGLIEEIVRIGDTLPGSADTVSELGSFRLANTGDVVFDVALRDGSSNRTEAVFWWDGDNITPILRGGDPFDGSTFSGDFNSVRWLLNDSEQLALTLELTDGRVVMARFSRGAVGLPGDHNGDGTVDAADYVAWRKGFGTIFDESHYTAWRNNFGTTSMTAAAGSSASVPEPSPLLLALLGAVAGLLRPARRHRNGDL